MPFETAREERKFRALRVLRPTEVAVFFASGRSISQKNTHLFALISTQKQYQQNGSKQKIMIASQKCRFQSKFSERASCYRPSGRLKPSVRPSIITCHY